MIKLLDGLRLDEKATASLLLAAGNRYEMSLIQDAIKIQYPAGMSITGLPRGRPDFRKRAPASSASSSVTRTTASSRWRSSLQRPTAMTRPEGEDVPDDGEAGQDEVNEGWDLQVSKQLAGLVQAHGTVWWWRHKGSSKGISKGHAGKGKGSMVRGSLCLGCGSADHWLKDCPSYNVQNAQLASAGFGEFTLDAEGMVSSTWMVHSIEASQADEENECSCYSMPDCMSSTRFLAFLYNPQCYYSTRQGIALLSSLRTQAARDR